MDGNCFAIARDHLKTIVKVSVDLLECALGSIAFSEGLRELVF